MTSILNQFLEDKKKMEILSRVCMILYALFLFSLHFVRIFDQNFWADEAFTINTVRENFMGMIHITAMDVHPPLYYIIVKFFAEIFGYTGATYHLVSIIPYGIVLILGLTIIWKWFGKETTVVFITFAALLSTSIQMNVEVRMYSWGALFVLVCFLALYKILTDENKYAWIVFTLSGLSAAYTHYYCLISVAFFYVVLILYVLIRERRYFYNMLRVCVITVVVYLPWLFVLLETFERSTDEFWQTGLQPMIEFVDVIFDSEYSLLFMAIFVISFLVWMLMERKLSEMMIWMLAGIAALVGTAVVGILVSVLVRPMFISRYLYPVSIVAWLLVGICISKFKGKIVYALIVTGLILSCGLPEYMSIYIEEKESNNKLEYTLELANPLIEEDDIIITNDVFIYWSVAELYYPQNQCDYFDFVYPDLDIDKTYWCINTKKLSDKKQATLLEKGLKTELIESDGVLGTYKVWIYKLNK